MESYLRDRSGVAEKKKVSNVREYLWTGVRFI